MSLDRAYIKSVNLKGYKTIKDLSATFNPGLNIIIGKNGGGKTNFMTFLNNVLTSDLNTLIDTSFNLEIDGGKKVKLSADRTLASNKGSKRSNKDLIELINSSYGEYKIESAEKNITRNSWEDIQKSFTDDLRLVTPIFIPHGLPKSNLIIDIPITFPIVLRGDAKFSKKLITLYAEKEKHSHFVRMLALRIALTHFEDKTEDKDFNEDEFSEITISEVVEIYVNNLLIDINDNISLYLPIEQIRLNPALNVNSDGDADSVTVSNFVFEYQVNGNWLQFESLSDGTKRLLSMFLDIFSFKIDKLNFLEEDTKQIVLLEEPELGIHPHLLTNFLKFIKEYSQYMQIIITTHSPLALNIIGEDDLDMINICKYDPTQGTTLNKLTDEQKEHAKLYIKEMYLSDYWQYSTLED